MRGYYSPLATSDRLRVVVLVAFFILTPVFAGAIEFDLLSGKITGHFDTTATMGLAWRVSDRDPSIIGTTNGGTGFSLNGDDGNLNYDNGDIFSTNFKVLHEISFDYEETAVFIRGFYFRDFAVTGGDVLKDGRPPLSGSAERYAGMNGVLLDAWIRRDFGSSDNPLTVTLGSQVINWGESTFIQNGLNTINPIDVSKLRAAGSELKEALVPIPAARFDYDVSDSVSLQGFYQLSWRPTRLEPAGTFFSITDIASPGGNHVLLGFGVDPNVIDNPPGFDVPPPNNQATPGTVVERTDDRNPDDMGQFGLSARWFSDLMGGTELGFFYTHLHSRLPIISAVTGISPQNLPPGQFYGDTAEYFLEFPEDIDTMGVGFNTDFFNTGIALQGEYSLHLDQPLQVDDVELLFGALGPFSSLFGQSTVGYIDTPLTLINGFRRKDVSQAQFTMTKLISGWFGADQIAMVGEFGATFVHEFEDQADFRYEATGTYTSGNDVFSDPNTPVQPGTEPLSAFPDALSMGYRVLVRGSYYNAVGSLSLTPTIALYHDIGGTSPVPVANFIEHRKTISTSVALGSLGVWDVKFGYTNSFGAGRYNLRNDRDFMSLTYSYSY